MERSAIAVVCALTLLVPGTSLAAQPSQAGPGFAAPTHGKKPKAQLTEASIRGNIKTQKEILELEDPSSPDYPMMMVALADFYWDLSEVFERRALDSLDDQLFDAREAGQTELAKELEEQRRLALEEMDYNRELAVATYRKVVARYPTAQRADEVRYFLGYYLTLMQRSDEAAPVFTELVHRHPDSPFVPDALVNVAEGYFAASDFVNALKLYRRAATYKDAPTRPFAIYKQAWCQYNLRSYELSLASFIEVIEISRANALNGIRSTIGLAKEAAGDMVLPYAKIGKVKGAMDFFRKWAGERYLELTGKLAGIYGEETDFRKSNALLRQLIREARTARPGGKDMRYMTIRFQRQIVSNAEATGDKKLTVGEVRELIRLYTDLQGKAPKKFLDRESAGVDELILALATSYHREYEITRKEETLAYTQLLYDEYLRVFSDRPNAYAITMNNALLMYMTAQFYEKSGRAEEARGKYEEAAAEFEKVIALRPKGKYADEAAERAVMAYLKVIRSKLGPLKRKGEAEDLAKQELSADAQRFVHAVDRWMGILARKPDIDAADRPNIAKARFLAAYLYYLHNQWRKAARRFAAFVEEHSAHAYGEDAARYVLDCYNKAKEKDPLLKYADEYEQHPDLRGSVALAEDIRKIRREFDFIKCFDFERAEDFPAAAACFSRYAEQHPSQDGQAPVAIFNAAVNYFKAKQVEQAIKTQNRLYRTYRKADNKDARAMAEKALYAIAEIFRDTTVYEEAANVYWHFTSKHPKHDLARKALELAAIYRKTLGQYSEAVEHLELYLERYPKHPRAAQIHLDIVLIRKRQGAHRKTVAAVRQHLKRFPSEPAGIRLRALNAAGLAYLQLDKDDKAVATFERMVELYRQLDEAKRGKLSMDERAAIAEAHFHLGKNVLRRALRIKLSSTDDAEVAAALTRKLDMMNATKAVFNAVIGYGHPGWTIAAYTQHGRAYRNLANAVEEHPIPESIRGNLEAIEIYKQKMAEKALLIRARAVASYQEALKLARQAHWFNEFSEQAEQAIAQLDMTDTSVKEIRTRPDQTGPNRGFPAFRQ